MFHFEPFALLVTDCICTVSVKAQNVFTPGFVLNSNVGKSETTNSTQKKSPRRVVQTVPKKQAGCGSVSKCGHIVPCLETNADNRPGKELSVEKSQPRSAPDIRKTSTAQRAHPIKTFCLYPQYAIVWTLEGLLKSSDLPEKSS